MKNAPVSDARKRSEIPGQSLSRGERDFLRIAAVSTAIGFGVMAGAIQSLRDNGAGFYFTISTWTVLASVAGAGMGLVFWKLIRQGKSSGRTAVVLLLIFGGGGFLSPLRFVTREKLPEIAKGLAIAACIISIGATLLWQVKRSLEDDAGP